MTGPIHAVKASGTATRVADEPSNWSGQDRSGRARHDDKHHSSQKWTKSNNGWCRKDYDSHADGKSIRTHPYPEDLLWSKKKWAKMMLDVVQCSVRAGEVGLSATWQGTVGH